MLLKLAFVLEKNFDYFLLDTPYAKCDSIIDNEIAAKLKKCNVTTLITVKMQIAQDRNLKNIINNEVSCKQKCCQDTDQCENCTGSG